MSPISILGNSLHIMHIMQCITKTMLHYWSSFWILAQTNPSVSQEHSNHKDQCNQPMQFTQWSFFYSTFFFWNRSLCTNTDYFQIYFFKSYFFKTNLCSTSFGPFHFRTGLHLHVQYTLWLQNCSLEVLFYWIFIGFSLDFLWIFIGFSLDFHWIFIGSGWSLTLSQKLMFVAVASLIAPTIHRHKLWQITSLILPNDNIINANELSKIISLNTRKYCSGPRPVIPQ